MCAKPDVTPEELELLGTVDDDLLAADVEDVGAAELDEMLEEARGEIVLEVEAGAEVETVDKIGVELVALGMLAVSTDKTPLLIANVALEVSTAEAI